MSSTTIDTGLLRLSTVGSVDDGKSTLVGRLLFDTKSLFADTIEAVERASVGRGNGALDLSLVTDGLRAEREQGITIDVAYRYFATPRRKFVLADCPGHVQYTRNTVTGASTADVVVVLVDARHGILEQTKRHLAIAALMRVQHVVLAVNKFDLVDWDEQVFRAIETEFLLLGRALGIHDVTAIPVSALLGDNIAEPSAHVAWYSGPTLLDFLESVEVLQQQGEFRFPVQTVILPRTAEFRDYRGYAGQITGGRIAVGDRVIVHPAGIESTVAGIDTYDGPLAEAIAPQSVVIRLEHDIDVTRGDLLAKVSSTVRARDDLLGTVCWLAERALKSGRRVYVRIGTALIRGIVEELVDGFDIDSFEPVAIEQLELNDIGRVRIRLAQPVAYDTYEESRRTGSFALIDEQSGDVLGAGLVAAALGESWTI